MILSIFTVAKVIFEVLMVLQELKLKLKEAKAHDLDYQACVINLCAFYLCCPPDPTLSGQDETH